MATARKNLLAWVMSFMLVISMAPALPASAAEQDSQGSQTVSQDAQSTSGQGDESAGSQSAGSATSQAKSASSASQAATSGDAGTGASASDGASSASTSGASASSSASTASQAGDASASASDAASSASTASQGATTSGEQSASAGAADSATSADQASSDASTASDASSTSDSSSTAGTQEGAETPVDATTSLADGTYEVAKFTAESKDDAKVAATCETVQVADGLAYAIVTFRDGSLAKLRSGGKDIAPESEGATAGSTTFKLPVDLNATMTVLTVAASDASAATSDAATASSASTAASEKKIVYTIKVELEEPSAASQDSDDADSEQAAQDSDTASTAASSTKKKSASTATGRTSAANELGAALIEQATAGGGFVAPKGDYTVLKNIQQGTGTNYGCFEVIKLSSEDMQMFRVVDATLHSSGTSMTATITLSGTGQNAILMDTSAEAATAAEEAVGGKDNLSNIPGIIMGTLTTNSEGKEAYQFEIPVSGVDEKFYIASYSHNNDKWYYRCLKLHMSSVDGLEEAVEDTYIDPIISGIDRLPAPEDITVDDAATITALREKYNGLSSELRGKVTNIATLEAAEEALADARVAKAVEDQIDALPDAKDVTESDRKTATDVEKAFLALSDSQEARISAASKQKLEAVLASVPSVTVVQNGDGYTLGKTVKLGSNYSCVEVTSTGPDDQLMFRVVDATISVNASGAMTLYATLSGTGQDKLYLGTTSEAQNATTGIISGEKVTNSEGKEAYRFAIPIDSLDTPILLASHSSARDKWYSRCIIVDSQNLTPSLASVVEGMIADLPSASDVKSSDASAIEAAREAFDSLPSESKDAVSSASYDKLVADEVALAALSGDEAAAKLVEERIDSLPPASQITSDDAWDVESAAALYDALTDSQKALISQEALQHLTDAEKALGDAQEADQQAANAVARQIEALPSAGDVTTGDADAIQAARDAYNALTAAQKALVPSDVVSKLAADEEALAAAQQPSDPDDSGSGGGSSGSSGGSDGTGDSGSSDGNSGYTANTSGTTSSIDNSVDIADGVYTPSGFGWSGGSGRLKGITCSQVRVSGGKAYATIVIQSSSYSYVKVNGQTYYCSTVGDTSVVEIPVVINGNTTILGCTTAMSTPHEVEYTISVMLDGVGGSSGSSSSSGTIGSSTSLDEEAPTIAGFSLLSEEEQTDVSYAKYFKIYNYDQGVTLVEIDLASDTARDPELLGDGSDGDDSDSVFSDDIDVSSMTTVSGTGDSSAASDEGEATSSDAASGSTSSTDSSSSTSSSDSSDEESDDDADAAATELQRKAALYQGNVVKYLIVPEGVEVLAGMDKQIVVIQQPKEKSYVASEDALSLLDSLGLVDKISTVGFEKDNVLVESVKAAMEGDDPAITYAGSGYDPSYKDLLLGKSDIAITSRYILPRIAENKDDDPDVAAWLDSEWDTDDDGQLLTVDEQTERLTSQATRFTTLEIPMIVDRSSDEDEDIAKAEWVKVYGAIYGKQSEAQEIFDAAVKAAEEQGTLPETTASE